MKCQRCLGGKEAKYRVYSDVLDLKVCSSCAAEACALRLAVELLCPDESRTDSANGGPKHRAHELWRRLGGDLTSKFQRFPRKLTGRYSSNDEKARLCQKEN